MLPQHICFSNCLTQLAAVHSHSFVVYTSGSALRNPLPGTSSVTYETSFSAKRRQKSLVRSERTWERYRGWDSRVSFPRMVAHVVALSASSHYFGTRYLIGTAEQPNIYLSSSIYLLFIVILLQQI